MPSSPRDQPPKTAATRKTGRPPKVELRLGERRRSAGILDRERTLETLLQNLPDAVVRVDREGRHIYANPACEKVLGIPPEAMIGKTVKELPIAANLGRTWASRISKVVASGKARSVRDVFEGPRGAVRHETKLVPELDEHGQVATVLIVVHDFGERHRAEKNLQESEERFRVTFEQAPIAMLLIDDAAHVRDANPAATRLLGYSHKELVGKTIHDITHPEDREPTHDVDARISERSESTVATEKRYLRKDGEIVWGRLSVSAVSDPEQGFINNIAQIVDVTQLKLAEWALREREELQSAVIEQATDVIAVISLDFTIRLISRSVRNALGYELEELIGQKVEELVTPEMLEGARTAATEILAGGPSKSRSFRLRHRNGDWRLFEGVGSVAHDESGEPSYIVVVLRDVTERTQLERQLLVAQKMEAVGQLAGGVAHDFNNLLTVINGFADISLKTLDGREDAVRNYLGEIGRAGQRAAELTQHLLAFSRQQVLQPEVVDVNAIVEEYASMLRRMLGEEIELLTRLEPDLHSVEVDPGQLGQVLTNLAVNARDAMPDGGTVTIGTNNVELEKAPPFAHGSLSRGSYVVLSVADVGEGISLKAREHVFEPFFTTKEPGQGTGLGLATVLGIVEQSGGAITIDSEPETGTVFRIYLPRSKAATRAKPVRAEGMQRGAGTILFVEDDDAVRKLVAKILLEAGYRVLVTSSAREALTQANWEPSIDVLVTDVVMPEMNGHDLARRLLSLRPDLRVLYISGYTPDVVRARGVIAHQEAFLQKPFTAAALIQAVRNLSAESPPAERT
jgi:two-component system cell cycle sensor histidine kinase/response regulator CckA